MPRVRSVAAHRRRAVATGLVAVERVAQPVAERGSGGSHLGVGAPRLDLQHEPEARIGGEERDQMVENGDARLDVRRPTGRLDADAAPAGLRAHAFAAGHPGEASAVRIPPLADRA